VIYISHDEGISISHEEEIGISHEKSINHKESGKIFITNEKTRLRSLYWLNHRANIINLSMG